MEDQDLPSGVEPIYVNERQYARIMKRREARMKLEAEGRIPKERRVILVKMYIFILNVSL